MSGTGLWKSGNPVKEPELLLSRISTFPHPLLLLGNNQTGHFTCYEHRTS